MLTRLVQLKSRRLGLQAGFVLMIAIVTLGATTDRGTRFNNLGHKLMCTCGCGQVLLECNHVGCQSSDKMRGELQAAISGSSSGPAAGGVSGSSPTPGGSDDQILNWFVEKYGAVVLAAPTKTGFNRVAWIMPYAALLAGLSLTMVIVRLWKARPQAAAAADVAHVDAAGLDALRRRVHEETEL
jgi:cytochrome c-type biogenesis protein CcmH